VKQAILILYCQKIELVAGGSVFGPVREELKSDAVPQH
jgi:hypothetical protein